MLEVTAMSTSPASVKAAFTVASYNICHGLYADFDWVRLTAPIRRVGADLVGIQEVDMHTNRSRGYDSTAALAEAVGLPYTLFVSTMPYDGGRYGTAILSRYPITAGVVIPLESGDQEPRAFGCVTLDRGEGNRLYFINTHLSYQSADIRHLQMAELAIWMKEHIPTDAPCVLTGDFNTEHFGDFAPLTTAGRSYTLINNAANPFMTFHDPAMAIDNIVYTPDRLASIGHGMEETDASDHNLLWCRFSDI